MRSWTVIAALAVIGVVRAPTASAFQLAGAGTGSVVGVVTDAAGLVVPRATVTIVGPAIMAQRQATSGEDGTYQVAGLLPGDYLLTFSSPGFASVERHARVGLGFTLTLDVMLAVAAQREAVAVYGVLDRYSAAVSTTFTARQLDQLPTSRNMGGLFALTHAMALSVAEVGGGTGIPSGGYGAYGPNASPRHTIEGIVVTGLFGGAGFTPDYGALEEVSILTAAHGAEWPSAGIHTDFVTKSGANYYRGAVYGAAEHRRAQASNVDADQIRRGASAGGGLLPDQANQVWRSSDLNADMGGFVRRDRLWWYASVRRQELAQRLVNFPVEPSLTRLTNVSGKVTYRASQRQTIVAYGQRGSNHQPHRLDPFGPAGSGLSASNAVNDTTASTADQRNAAWLWKVDWAATPSDAMVLSLRAGAFGWRQAWTPRSSAPRFEDIETLVVKGGNRDWQYAARRDQVTGTLTWFTQNSTGGHQLRAGGEALRFLAQESWSSAYPGDVLHVLRDGRPSSVFLFATPSESEAGLWNYSLYASDAWQVAPRLRLTLGVRFDRYRLFLPAQGHPAFSPAATRFEAVPRLAAWNVLTPRLAAVFDLGGDGRSLVKLSYGRYRVAPNAALAFNSSPNSNVWWNQYEWTDPNLSGEWEPGEEGRLQRGRGGGAVESIDPDLRLPVVDEVGAWIERAAPAGIVLRAGLLARLERSLFARQNANQPFDAFTVPVPISDRGPDGLPDTADDGPPVIAYDLDPDFIGQPAANAVRNVPDASGRYLTLEVEATRQLRGRWAAGAGLTYSWNGDEASGYAGQVIRQNALPLTPNDLLNTGHAGRHEFTTWTAKAHGTLELPGALRVTAVLRHQSGQPFGRTQTTDRGQLSYGTVTLLMEPVGARRLDDVTLIDVRLARTWSLASRQVGLFLDVFNGLNTNAEQAMVWASGPSFQRPLTIVPPRIARVGLAFDW